MTILTTLQQDYSCLTPLNKKLNDFFSCLFHRLHMVNGDEITSSVVHMVITLCRMMSIVALVRSLQVALLAKPLQRKEALSF